MKAIKILVNNVKETEEFALNLAKESKPGNIYCLNGDLGVGKTVIAKAFGKFFNVNETITSPTFTILKSYNCKEKNGISKINHFDLYRIKNIDELENIGFSDIIYENNAIILIEWPEIAFDLLPSNIININISKQVDNEFKRIILIEK